MRRLSPSIGVLALVAAACGECSGSDQATAPEPSTDEPAGPASSPTPEKVYAPGLPDGSQGGNDRRIVAAFRGDRAYAGQEPVRARRLVYRVSLLVPPALGNAPKTLPSSKAELYVDVSADRLRARFAGAGWPVATGAEIRIRRDEPGAYVFDERGGRPLGPGQMVSWFQGGRVRRHPPVRIQPPDSEEQVGPGTLLCRLLAEWGNEAPDALAHRCGDGGSPPRFRIGPWRAERTADVAVQLPRAALRADHRDPPEAVKGTASRAFLPPALLRRIDPVYVPPGGGRQADGAPAEGLRVVNHGRSRIVVIVRGVPIGWVDRDATGLFVGLPTGNHRIGAMRPVGVPALPARSVYVPGEIRLRR